MEKFLMALSCFCIMLYCSDVLALSDEKRLIKHLLDNYKKVGKVGRPVYNTSATVSVEYGVALVQILDLDEKNQVLTTNVWSRYQWHDMLLRWDVSKFGGVDQVRIPTDNIWTPDIVLYNYADTRLKEQRSAMAVVDHEGTVLWIPMAIFKSTCSIDITHFPFDEQTCRMKFGSWTYDGFKLDVNFYGGLEAVDITDYIESNEWKLLAHPAVKNIKKYPCCVEPYPDLTFELKIKRIAAFYSYILILPCVLLSSLTLVIFWLPPESPAKMVLGMNIFVAFFVLLLLLADSTPPAASSIPLIGAYFCLNMILITLSTFLSVIVINLYFRGDKQGRVPRWLRRIMVDGLARVFCMRADIVSGENRMEHIHVDSGKEGGRKKKLKCPPEMKYNKFQPPMFDISKEGNDSRNHTSLADKSPLHNQLIEQDIREIRRSLRAFLNRLSEKDVKGKIAMEWRTVALVLDRLFFFMYLTTIIVSLATIFPRA